EESEAEESFVRKFCDERGIALHAESIAWKRMPSNLEESARRVRYRKLEKMAAESRSAQIALAHHRDDAAETVLLRLIRGSGASGLASKIACFRKSWKRNTPFSSRLQTPVFPDKSMKSCRFRRKNICS